MTLSRKTAEDRLRREMLVLQHKVDGIARGYNDDPPEIAGVRQFVALAWNQIGENIPLVRNTMHAMHGGEQ
jgi:hypothetical protein